ncbi:MAG: hypothetical protein JWN13_5404 [Betaproteobacteria bacterium]|nr:hypothetical protein [Betaproteobacteria bacterium]
MERRHARDASTRHAPLRGRAQLPLSGLWRHHIRRDSRRLARRPPLARRAHRPASRGRTLDAAARGREALTDLRGRHCRDARRSSDHRRWVAGRCRAVGCRHARAVRLLVGQGVRGRYPRSGSRVGMGRAVKLKSCIICGAGFRPLTSVKTCSSTCHDENAKRRDKARKDRFYSRRGRVEKLKSKRSDHRGHRPKGKRQNNVPASVLAQFLERIRAAIDVDRPERLTQAEVARLLELASGTQLKRWLSGFHMPSQIYISRAGRLPPANWRKPWEPLATAGRRKKKANDT